MEYGEEGHVIALEDNELNEWLIQAIEEGSTGFISALAEAVVIACPEDYLLVRPVLMSLKGKYRSMGLSVKENEQTKENREMGTAKRLFKRRHREVESQ